MNKLSEARADALSIAQVKQLVAQEVARERAAVKGEAYHAALRAAQLRAPVETQGVDMTPLSERHILVEQVRRSNARVRSGWKTGVDEDRGRDQLQAALRRAPAPLDDSYAEAAAAQAQAYQQRCLADSQRFEEQMKQDALDRQEQALRAATDAGVAYRRHVEQEGARNVAAPVEEEGNRRRALEYSERVRREEAARVEREAVRHAYFARLDQELRAVGR
jgi:hypothetical protein